MAERSIERSEKVTTPLTALVDRVPESVPPPGLVLIAIVTVALLVLTRLPPASSTLSTRAGLIVWPAVTALGPWV